MSIPEKKLKQLEAFFSVLSERHRQVLVMAIKAAKADGEKVLPCDDLLILLGHDEIPQDRCLELFTVAQPLMVETARRCDQIEVSLVKDVWDFFLRDLNPKMAAAWLSDDVALDEIRPSVVSMFGELLATDDGLQTLQARFGDGRIEQLKILISLMQRPDDLQDFFAGWPEVVKNLNEELIAPLRDFNDFLMAENPEITPHLLFLVAAHLEQPFQVFRAVEKVTGHSNDRVMVKTELKVVGDALLDQNDIFLDSFTWEKGQVCDVEAMVLSLRKFVKLTAGWMSEFEIDPDGPWGTRLASQRSLCGKKWGDHMGRVRKTVDLVLPRRRGKLTGRQTMPDLNKDIDEASIALAENEIELLLTASSYASQSGFQASKDKAAKALETRLEDQGRDLLSLLGREDIEDYQKVSAHFAVLVRITHRYLGEEEASILTRRSVAAMAA